MKINVAAFSKVDGVYNPFVKPDPIHICTVHEHDDPMVQFMHEEVLKFGNITKVSEVRKPERGSMLKQILVTGLSITQGSVLLSSWFHH